jgi:saccharopine dehydrogenase-like NADP-dependent oxidoreductase
VRAVVVGAGAVGARAARQLHATEGLEGLVVADRSERRAQDLAGSMGWPARWRPLAPEMLEDADVAVLAVPAGQRRWAEAALERGAHVVSVADGYEEVKGLLDLDAEARERDLTVAVGAGFAPGLSCVLARHAASAFDRVDEVHVAWSGAGGPACVRARRQALRHQSVEWLDGAWVRARGGSGAQLYWFPEPIAAQECVRAGTPAPLLLAPAFPAARRVTARLAVGRAPFAFLGAGRRSHAEGGVGAIRVEVRGRRDGVTDVSVLGALDKPAVAAGTVAAVAAAALADGRVTRPGVGGLGELVADPVPFLQELARRGVRAAVYEGAGSAG